jgi:hypothetical protein
VNVCVVRTRILARDNRYQNNPGFRVWGFQEGAESLLTDFSLHALSVNTTAPLSPSQALVQWSASLPALEENAAALLTDDTAWNAYVGQMFSSSSLPAVAQARATWGFRASSYCAIRFWRNDTFDACTRCYAAGYDPKCP